MSDQLYRCYLALLWGLVGLGVEPGWLSQGSPGSYLAGSTGLVVLVLLAFAATTRVGFGGWSVADLVLRRRELSAEFMVMFSLGIAVLGAGLSAVGGWSAWGTPVRAAHLGALAACLAIGLRSAPCGLVCVATATLLAHRADIGALVALALVGLAGSAGLAWRRRFWLRSGSYDVAQKADDAKVRAWTGDVWGSVSAVAVAKRDLGRYGTGIVLGWCVLVAAAISLVGIGAGIAAVAATWFATHLMLLHQFEDTVSPVRRHLVRRSWVGWPDLRGTVTRAGLAISVGLWVLALTGEFDPQALAACVATVLLVGADAVRGGPDIAAIVQNVGIELFGPVALFTRTFSLQLGLAMMLAPLPLAWAGLAVATVAYRVRAGATAQ